MSQTSTPNASEPSYFPGLEHPAFHLLEYFFYDGKYFLSLKGGYTFSFQPKDRSIAAFQQWLDHHGVHRVRLSKFQASGAEPVVAK